MSLGSYLELIWYWNFTESSPYQLLRDQYSSSIISSVNKGYLYSINNNCNSKTAGDKYERPCHNNVTSNPLYTNFNCYKHKLKRLLNLAYIDNFKNEEKSVLSNTHNKYQDVDAG